MNFNLQILKSCKVLTLVIFLCSLFGPWINITNADLTPEAVDTAPPAPPVFLEISNSNKLAHTGNIMPSSTYTGVSIDVRAQGNFVGSGISLVVSNGNVCTDTATTTGVLSSVDIYQESQLIGSATIPVLEYTSTLNNTGCVYNIPGIYNLDSGLSQLDVVIRTSTGSFNNLLPFEFNIDSYSFKSVNDNLGNTLDPSYIVGFAQSDTFTPINVGGIDSITKSYVSNPQVMIRENQSTAIKFAIRANAVKDLVLKNFDLDILGYDNLSGGVIGASLLIGESTSVTDYIGFANTTGTQFSGLNITIPAGTSQEFWVMIQTNKDMPTEATTSPYDLQFASSNFVLIDSDNNTIVVPQQYSRILGNQIDIKANILVTGSILSKEVTNIIAGTGSQSIGSFELRSQDIDTVLEEISLVNLDPDFSESSITAASASGHISSSTDGLIVQLYQGSNLLGQAQLLNGVAYIDLVDPITLRVDTPAVFDIRIANFSQITSPGDTNKIFRLGVLSPGSIIDNAQTLISAVNSSVEAIGSFSMIFNPQILRATSISFSDVVNPTDSLEDNLNTIEGQSQATIFKTIISVNTSKSATISKLSFEHETNGITISNYKLKVDNEVLSTTDATCVYTTAIVCSFGGAYANGLTIAAGGMRTIELVASVGTQTSQGRGSITTSIQKGPPNDYDMNTAALVNPNTSVVRSDNAEPNVTYGSNNWFSDAGLEKLPSTIWTFVRDGGLVGSNCSNGANNYPACDNVINIQNVRHTKTGPNQYLIQWNPLVGQTKVEIAIKNTAVDSDYRKITTVMGSDGGSTIYLESNGLYLIKLTAVDDLSTPLGLDQIVSIQYDAYVNPQSVLQLTSSLPKNGKQYIPSKSQNNKVLKLDFISIGGVSAVPSIRLRLSGLVNRDHISVSAVNSNGTVIASGNVFNSEFTSQVNLGLILTSGATESVELMFSTTDSINERFTISIDSPLDVFATGGVLQGVFPIVSDEISTESNVDPEFELAYQWMKTNNIINTQSAQELITMGAVKRQQAAVIVNRYASVVAGVSNVYTQCAFDDISALGSGVQLSILGLCAKGLTRYQYGSSYSANENYLKSDLITVLSKLSGGLQYESDIDRTHEYCVYAQEHGITRESNCNSLTRAITMYELVLMLYRGRDSYTSNPTGLIMGKIRSDGGDGVYQSGEPLLDTISMYLYRCDLGTGNVGTGMLLSTTVTSSGWYAFSGILIGSYQVRVGKMPSTFTNPKPTSECMSVTSTGVSIFDSYGIVPIKVIYSPNTSYNYTSISSTNSTSSSNPFMPTTNSSNNPSNNPGTNIEGNKITTKTLKTSTTQSPTIVIPKTPSQTTISDIKSIDVPTKNNAINTIDNLETDTNTKYIVTIKINDDGSIGVIKSIDTSTLNPTTSDVNNDTYLARDLTIQYTNSTSQVPTNFVMKPYWIITPEMLAHISILQQGYQPAWDATPFRVNLQLDPTLSSRD